MGEWESGKESICPTVPVQKECESLLIYPLPSTEKEKKKTIVKAWVKPISQGHLAGLGVREQPIPDPRGRGT